MPFTLHRPTADDWEKFRELRLRMLADTPIAYGETLAQSLAYIDEEWQNRAAHANAGTNAAVVAVAQDGEWIGIMRGYLSPRTGPMLVGVFVDARHRGRDEGVADALLDGIVEWARGVGPQLRLEVHADNPRAMAYYRRRGFVETGNRRPYELPPYGDEVEMELRL
ncbi:GNAT family N-acetyltransferase [Microbacterium stercoris]|uniref:GNAT family N-acetyltransferase n=1 Tax=Microbacterium stercoris TaxID=2820289 RepID=A0A939TRJ6_9MICO|nr:GNAT family N-acetyltransferase [Microbacterium stercoris]MBO3664216.1 GNAT family N-acetyltransferase [Microbacterium stercoris]